MLKLGSSWDSTRGMDLFDPSLETVKDEMSFKMSGELSLATPQAKLRAKWLDSNPWVEQRTKRNSIICYLLSEGFRWVGCWWFVLGGGLFGVDLEFHTKQV